MSGRNIPYIVGAFMITPLILWIGLWAFVLPGPKYGTDVPLTMALGLVSLPLVAWFYLASLGMVANSIEGADSHGSASNPLVRRLVAALPAITLLLGVLTVPLLLVTGGAWFLTPIPLAVAVIIAWAIRKGEQARALDARAAMGEHTHMLPGAIAAAKAVARALGRLLFAIPLVGPLLREGLTGSNEDQGFFALTLLLAAILAVFLFGYPALIASALTATLLAFAFITFTIFG